jgi:hypothetical protein
MDSATTHDATTAAHPALATVAGDQCTSCSAPLAPDQRYCVQCGQRRGQARMPVSQASTAPARADVIQASHPRAPRPAFNTALIAGIGTLLLAMGVGVLIGRSGQKSPSSRAAAPVQVVTVGGAGGASGASVAATSPTSAKPAAGKSSTSKTATKAASHVKGTTVKLPKKAVVTVGTPGTGPGYQKGKFTGNFFGGG